MNLAIGPMVRMMTRSMYAQIASAPSWYSHLILDNDSLEELNFWSTSHDFDAGHSFRPRPVTSKILFCDASDTGYGGFLVRHLGKDVFKGKFGVAIATDDESRNGRKAVSSFRFSV